MDSDQSRHLPVKNPTSRRDPREEESRKSKAPETNLQAKSRISADEGRRRARQRAAQQKVFVSCLLFVVLSFFSFFFEFLTVFFSCMCQMRSSLSRNENGSKKELVSKKRGRGPKDWRNLQRNVLRSLDLDHMSTQMMF